MFLIKSFFQILISASAVYQSSENTLPLMVTPPVVLIHFQRPTLHKKWSFPLRISSVNVTKSAGFVVRNEAGSGGNDDDDDDDELFLLNG